MAPDETTHEFPSWTLAAFHSRFLERHPKERMEKHVIKSSVVEPRKKNLPYFP